MEAIAQNSSKTKKSILIAVTLLSIFTVGLSACTSKSSGVKGASTETHEDGTPHTEGDGEHHDGTPHTDGDEHEAD